jgi:hypothetical protein
MREFGGSDASSSGVIGFNAAAPRASARPHYYYPRDPWQVRTVDLPCKQRTNSHTHASTEAWLSSVQMHRSCPCLLCSAHVQAGYILGSTPSLFSPVSAEALPTVLRLNPLTSLVLDSEAVWPVHAAQGIDTLLHPEVKQCWGSCMCALIDQTFLVWLTWCAAAVCWGLRRNRKDSSSTIGTCQGEHICRCSAMCC